VSTLRPFPDTRDLAIVIVIGNKRFPTQWPVVPRVGEVIHGYTLGTLMFSGQVLGVEHHFDNEQPTIEVRLPTNSIRRD